MVQHNQRLAQFATNLARRQDSFSRTSSLAKYHKYLAIETADTLVKAHIVDKRDSAISFARELEVVSTELLFDEIADFTALNSFGIKEVQFGTKEHTFRRVKSAGKPKYVKDGGAIPTLSLEGAEETSKFETIALAYNLSVEGHSADLLRTINSSEVSRVEVVTALRSRLDELAWLGDDSVGINGVLNHPHLAKSFNTTLTISMATAAANPELILGWLNRLAAYSRKVSYGKRKPDTMYVSDRILSVIEVADYSTVAAATKTIMQRFLETHPDITKVISVSHLEDCYGVQNSDGVFLTRRGNAEDSGNRPTGTGLRLLLSGRPTWLAPQYVDMDVKHIAYAATAGIEMPDALSSIIGFATYEDSEPS